MRVVPVPWRSPSPAPAVADRLAALGQAAVGAPGPAGSAGAAEADRADDPDRPPRLLARLDPGARGTATLVVVAVAGAALAGVVVWRGRPRELQVAPPRVETTRAVTTLVVDVSGEVRRPGIVRLPDGSRVVDALRAAGGVLPGATAGSLNLARRLVDGEQVVVGGPDPGAPGAPGGPGAGQGVRSGSPLDLNSATVEQLDALPGIGPVLARRIVEWRTAHTRFTSVEQLREVPGIGTRTFESLEDLVAVL